MKPCYNKPCCKEVRSCHSYYLNIYFIADYDYDQSFSVVAYAENLVTSAVETALYEAAEKLIKQPHVDHSSSSQETQDSSFSKSTASTASTDSEIPMDHLEVNFRDWLAHYRRRSSNLSDLSSRRSSYDLPSSRRSSGCSTKYSSEFSSEFEEYYDNFQQQEKYKYHTIKEEVGPSVINEFALNLAQSLLREGTEAFAATKSEAGVQKFHSIQPSSVTAKPSPVKLQNIETESHQLSTESERLDSENEDLEIVQSSVRKFVDSMFSEIWPFQESKANVWTTAQSDMRNMIIQSTSHALAIKELEVVCILGNDDDIIHVYSDSESSGVGDEFDDGYNDESYLINVANDLVVKAFSEALIEYRQRYMYSGYKNINHSAISSECSSVADNDGSNDSRTSVSAANIADTVVTEIFDSIPDPGARPKVPKNNSSIIPLKAYCDNTLVTSDKQRLIVSQDEVTKSENNTVEISYPVLNYNTKEHSHISRESFDIINSIVHDEMENVINTGSVTDLDVNNSSHAISSSPVNQNIYGIREDIEHNKENSSPRRLSSRSTLSKSPNNNSLSERSMKIRSSPQRDSINISPINMSNSSSPKSAKSGSGLSKSSGSKSNNSSPGRSNRSSRKSDSGHKRIGSPANGHRSKKNYDQFANCLSRDLLTNVFLQVQDTGEGDLLSYPRRSSEPMQISNGAALQRLEHSVPTVNGKRTQKSKTDEDIGTFAEELSRHGASCDVGHRKSGSGFRDPILSR